MCDIVCATPTATPLPHSHPSPSQYHHHGLYSREMSGEGAFVRNQIENIFNASFRLRVFFEIWQHDGYL